MPMMQCVEGCRVEEAAPIIEVEGNQFGAGVFWQAGESYPMTDGECALLFAFYGDCFEAGDERAGVVQQAVEFMRADPDKYPRLTKAINAGLHPGEV